MKTLIAIPCMDQVPALFAQSLAMLQKVDDCAVVFNLGSLIYSSRNTLATKSITMEADYVLWLDSDMVFQPDTLVRMMDTLQKNDLDILTGLYFRRVNPYTPVLFDRLDIDGKGRCHWSEFNKIPDEVFEVGGCGFGCVLMKTDVFLDVQSKHHHLFTPIGETGEDVAFCWRARNCGFKIWCDPSIQLGHVGYTVMGREFYESFKAMNGAKNG